MDQLNLQQIEKITMYYQNIINECVMAHCDEDLNNPGFTRSGEVLNPGVKKDFQIYASLTILKNLLQN
tara:strand:- start:647 stop:850 length:204 start_codon:yes stop_codon:yes gene_type:complete